MARNLARRHQDCIETDITNHVVRICREPYFGSGSNPPALPLADRFCGLIETGAGFHFGEDQKVAAAGDDIDFAKRASPPPSENAESLCDQESGGAAFG